MADVEIQFYSPAGINRGIDPDTILQGVTWELLEAGGMGQATIPLADAFDEDHKVAGGDTVKIWVNGETHPRYIGRVATPSDTLDLAETLSLVCYGEMESMNRVRIGCKILRPGGADLAEFADYLLRHYSARKGETYEKDFQITGVLLESLDLDNATVREGFDKLFDQAPGAVVWGWEVNPATGNKRCYIRPRVETIGWAQYVGEGVRVINRAREFSDIVNRLAPLGGGKARFPNLLGLTVQDASGKSNASFERPAAATENGGNIVTDSSFEFISFGGTLIDWTPSGGADDKTEAARIGFRGVELDGLGETVSQQVNVTAIPPVPGNLYDFSVWGRRETGTHASIATATLKWRNNVGTQVGATQTLTIDPASVIYEEFTLRMECPATATGYSIEIELTTDAGDGVYIDDVSLIDVSGVTQPGWEVSADPDGSGVVNEVDYAYEDDAFHGCLSLYVDATASDSDGNDVFVRPAGNARVPVTGGQYIKYGFWVKSPPGETTVPEVEIRIVPKKSDGSGTGLLGDDIRTTYVAGPALADWTPYFGESVLDDEAVTTEFSLAFRSSGKLLIDAGFMRDGYLDVSGGGIAGYIEGDTWERPVAATDDGVATPGSSAYLSEGVYGRQEDTVTNESLVEWNDEAKAFARAWFEENAVIGGPQRVELDDEDEQIITPGDGTKFRVAGLATTFGDFWPSRTRYTWNGKLPVSVELGTPQITLAKLLASGGVSVSGGSASTGGGSTTINNPATNPGLIIQLCGGFLPVLGADENEVTIPYKNNGLTSATYALRRLTLHVAVPGGAPEIELEKYSGTGAFVGTSMVTLTMGSGDRDAVATSFDVDTVQSGDEIRFVVNDLGTATGWSIEAEFEQVG